MSAYQSKPGTYERLLKSFLEDPSLSDAEFRAAAYLASKPPGWVIYPEQLARALDRTDSWAKRALTDLRKRGLVVISPAVRGDRGAIKQRPSELLRDHIVAAHDLRAESARKLQAAETPESSQLSTSTQNLRASRDQPKLRIVAAQHLRADSAQHSEYSREATTDSSDSWLGSVGNVQVVDAQPGATASPGQTELQDDHAGIERTSGRSDEKQDPGDGGFDDLDPETAYLLSTAHDYGDDHDER